MSSLISYHKQLRQKEIKKNKSKRIAERDAKVATSGSLEEIQAEINKLEKQKSYKNGHLDSKDVRRLERLQKELRIVKDSEEERKKQAQEKAKLEWELEKKRMASKEGVNELNAVKFQRPKASVYYDAVLNPFGAPPPGKPMLYHKRGGGTTIRLEEASIPQHLRSGVDDDSTDKEEDQPDYAHRKSESRESHRNNQHRATPSPHIPQKNSDARSKTTRQTNPAAPESELKSSLTKEGPIIVSGELNKKDGVPALPTPSASVQRLIKKSKKQNMALNADIWASTDELMYEDNLEGTHPEDANKEKIFPNKKKRKAGDDKERFDPLCPEDEGYNDYRSSEQIKRSMTTQKKSYRDKNLDENSTVCAWYYIDQSQTVQGPFSSDHMSSWRQAGFFPDNTMVRNGTHGEFAEISSVDLTSGSLLHHILEYETNQIDKDENSVDERIALLRAELQTKKEESDGEKQNQSDKNDVTSSFLIQTEFPSAVSEYPHQGDYHQESALDYQSRQNHYEENEDVPYPIDISYPMDDAYPIVDSYPDTDAAFADNDNEDIVPYYYSSTIINETDDSHNKKQSEIKKKAYTGDSAVVQMIPSNLRNRRTNPSKPNKKSTKTPTVTSNSAGVRKGLTDDYEEFMSQVQSLK